MQKTGKKNDLDEKTNELMPDETKDITDYHREFVKTKKSKFKNEHYAHRELKTSEKIIYFIEFNKYFIVMGVFFAVAILTILFSIIFEKKTDFASGLIMTYNHNEISRSEIEKITDELFKTLTDKVLTDKENITFTDSYFFTGNYNTEEGEKTAFLYNIDSGNIRVLVGDIDAFYKFFSPEGVRFDSLLKLRISFREETQNLEIIDDYYISAKCFGYPDDYVFAIFEDTGKNENDISSDVFKLLLNEIAVLENK